MEPCKANKCIVQSDFTTASGETTASQNDGDLSSFATKILIPIVLVLGIFILVSIGIIAQRIIDAFTKRHNILRSGRRRNRGDEEAGAQSRSTISSISMNPEPPSYGQFIASIERQVAPPSYFKVVSGTVNLSFIDGDGSHDQIQASNNQTIGQQIENNALQNASNRHPLPACRGSVLQSGIPDENGRTYTADREETTQTSNNVSITISPELAEVNSVTRGTAYGNTDPPSVDGPVSIAIQDIDQIIDSIMVPSVLSPGSIRGKRNQRSRLVENNNVEECTSFSSIPCTACSSKTQANADLISAENENRVVLQSTPI